MGRLERSAKPGALETRCSFCGKRQDQVQRIVAGPGVFICNECVDLCGQILQAKGAGQGTAYPQAEDAESLLIQLQQAKTVLDILGPNVRKLRQQEVSWARIGAALGISRQAAWERFSGED